MKVSIIIIVYNEEKKIKKCIDSILAQTKKPYEIIITNDGSTDNTLKILERYKKKIKIINKKNNEGRAKAYIDSFNKAKGDIIAFIDGDSYAPKHWLAEISDAFNNSPNNTACIGGYYTPSNKEYLIPKLEDKFHEIIVKKGLFKFPSGTNMAYKKEICNKECVFNSFPEFRCDRYAMDLLIKKGYKIKIIDCNVFSKVPNKFTDYIKQRFRWGRGRPNAKMISSFALLQKIIITLLPLITLIAFFFYPTLTSWIISIIIITALFISILISHIWDFRFIEAIALLFLKSIGIYAHAIGYIFETMRRLI